MLSYPGGSGLSNFRARILQLRGRAGLTQRELAAHCRASERAVQAWEAGLSYPTPTRLKLLIALYLRRGVFDVGRLTDEVIELWDAAYQEAPRFSAPFDQAWFSELLAETGGTLHVVGATASSQPQAVPSLADRARGRDWGDAPAPTALYGRQQELDRLTGWILTDNCRVVAVLGMGGIGKTTLTVALTAALAERVDRIFWRSLRNALPFDAWLAGALFSLSPDRSAPAGDEETQSLRLLDLLREQRCLLVLDNLETVLDPGAPEGTYRPGYESYGRLLQRLAETEHRSCLLVTSREMPLELVPLEGGRAAVRTLRLGPLSEAAGRALLADRGIAGAAEDSAALLRMYGGNALALQVVSATIRDIFGGEIPAFLAQGQTVFGSVRRLLAGQLARLTPPESDVLYWLAIEREPITFGELMADLGARTSASVAIEAVESLARRSLLERGERGATLTLQSIILELATERLVDFMSEEAESAGPTLLATHALVKAHAKEYVRRSQEQLIVAPVLSRLVATCGGEAAAELRLLQLLDSWRGQPLAAQGCGPGNVVALLRLLRGNLNSVDLSRLLLRQLHLQGVDAHDANLSGSQLIEPVLSEAFDHPLSVAFSDTGEFLAAGTFSGEVRVWQLPARAPILSVEAHDGVAMAVALSGSGRLLASGGLDGLVRVWDAPSGRLLSSVDAHAGGVWGLALSGDGQLLASGGEDGTVKLWDHGGRHVLASFGDQMAAVRVVALSRDGSVLACGNLDGAVRVWDTASHRELPGPPVCEDTIRGVALTGDGRLLACGSLDGTIIVWDVHSTRVVTTVHGEPGGVWRVALSDDGQRLASAGGDGIVKVWDTSTGRPLAIMSGHAGTVRGVALDALGRVVASGSLDGTIKLWDASHGDLLATLQGYAGAIWGVALSGDGRLAASGALDGRVRLYEAASGRLISTVTGHRAAVWTVALNADGGLLASGGEDALVLLWDTATGERRHTLRGHVGGVRSVALSGDGRLVASGSLDGAVRLWDTASGRLLTTLSGHGGGVRGVALSADAARVVSGSVDGAVRLWDAQSGRLLDSHASHAGAVWSVAVSADGGLVASGSLDGAVRLWIPGDRRQPVRLIGHTGGVWGVALSGDGRLLISGGGDGAARLWDTASGQLLATLTGHTTTVAGVALSRDGRLAASGGGDGMVKLWEGPGGAERMTLRSARCYEGMDITGLTGVTEAQRLALQALGAVTSTA